MCGGEGVQEDCGGSSSSPHWIDIWLPETKVSVRNLNLAFSHRTRSQSHSKDHSSNSPDLFAQNGISGTPGKPGAWKWTHFCRRAERARQLHQKYNQVRQGQARQWHQVGDGESSLIELAECLRTWHCDAFIKALQLWNHANQTLRLAIDKPLPVPSSRQDQIKKRHGGNKFTLGTACLWLHCHFQLSTHVREKLWFPKCTPQLLLTNCCKFYFLAAFSHYAISLVLATYSTFLTTAVMKTVISQNAQLWKNRGRDEKNLSWNTETFEQAFPLQRLPLIQSSQLWVTVFLKAFCTVNVTDSVAWLWMWSLHSMFT